MIPKSGTASRPRLGVNIDHVATIRNARGGRHPDPVAAAKLAVEAGADGITAHLREDRRHIRDEDIARLKAEIKKPLNLEMAATAEMVGIACKIRPHAACIVPERRAERTTEGGLDAAGQRELLRAAVGELAAAGIRVSLFIAAESQQIAAAVAIGMSAVVAVVGTGRRRVVASFRSVGAAVSVGPADGIVVVVLGGSATRRGGASTSAGELAAGTDLTGS